MEKIINYYNDDICDIYDAINRAVGKKIIIYGTDMYSKKIFHILSLFDVNIFCFANKKEEAPICGKDVRSIYDILYEYDMNELFIFAMNPVKELNSKIIPVLDDLGFPRSNTRCIGIGLPYTFEFLPDHHLFFTVKEDLMGFSTFGDISTARLKIVTLGGSTTYARLDEFKSWSEFLYERLRCENYDVAVYCGGMPSYFTSQDLLKLMRDVIPMKPDIVLSYCGYNDLGHPIDDPVRSIRPYLPDRYDMFRYTRREKDNIFWGFPNDMSCCLSLQQNINFMHALCEVSDIKFLSFIQPALFYGNNEQHIENLLQTWESIDEFLVKYERIAYCCKKNYPEFMEIIKARSDDYIIDLTNLFNNYSNIYYDPCHVYERGNKIIADRIYDEIARKGLLLI